MKKFFLISILFIFFLNQVQMFSEEPPLNTREPKPPFPYKEQEVTFENRSLGVTLSGTLTMPFMHRPFPAVLLIAGSGPLDRDETFLGHKPFLVLADYLTRHGIAVLRMDKRGCGKSTGRYDLATSEDFASDVFAGIEYLKTRKEIRANQIGLIGHSEGGMIAPMVAAKSKDIAFIVLMAGVSVKGEEILKEQTKLLKHLEGASEKLIEEEILLLTQMFQVVKNEPDLEKADKLLRELCLKYARDFDTLKQEAKKSAGVEIDTEEYRDAQIRRLNTPWFRCFLNYDPTSFLKQVKVPVLALNGELDLQVLPEQNLPVIAKGLEEAGNTDYTIIKLPKINHLFQTCEIGSLEEYAKIEETISPGVLDIIAKWILMRTY